MTQITRGDVLLAGLALPGIADTANRDTADDDRPLQPKRFEEIVGFEVAEVAAVIPWRCCRWEAWSFTGCTIRWGQIPLSFQELRTA